MDGNNLAAGVGEGNTVFPRRVWEDKEGSKLIRLLHSFPTRIRIVLPFEVIPNGVRRDIGIQYCFPSEDMVCVSRIG